MSTKKSRDLAQELVDFLLKEEKQSKGIAPALANGKNENRVKPQLVSPFSVQQANVRPKKEDTPEDVPENVEVKAAKPTHEEATFISSIDVRLPDTQKRDPRLPKLEKTDIRSVSPAADAKGSGPTGGFTAIEFNIKEDDARNSDPNFVSSSEKAKEILSEITKDPLATEDPKAASQPDAQSASQSASQPSVPALSSAATGKVELKANIPKPLEPQESTHLSKSQAFSTQRSRIVVNEVTQLMAGAEAVKVAQARISSLERERDELRSETEELLSTTETLQRRFNELKAQHDTQERKHKERIEILEDEKAVIRTRLTAKEEDLDRIKKENEDLQMRFKNDLRKIRVRERELEHRQEIMKAEHATVVHSKDEMIIELKRTLERLHFELDNFRAKSADMNTKINEFYERNHRTVKALRLALSVLETGDNEEKPKKASG